jgi:predicted dehydrogenase/sugar phosphate isomerase/epimerase
MKQNSHKIKTAIIGYGRNGEAMHGQAVYDSERFDMVAVADIDPVACDKAVEKFKCRTYDDYNKMLREEDLDLVSIVTRSDQHCEMVCDCMAADVNTLITKPWCLNSSEAEKMIEASSRSTKKLLPWLPARWGADFLRLKEVIADGTIGRIFRIYRSEYSFATRNDWQTEKQYGGGYLLNWGPHIIEPPILLAESKVKDIYGVLNRVINPGDVEDLFSGTITLENGVVIQAEYNINAAKKLPRWIVQGDKGTIVVDGTTMTIYSGEPSAPLDPTQKEYMSSSEIKITTEELTGSIYGDTNDIYQVIACAVNGEQDYPVKLESALYLTRIFDAVRQSAKERNVEFVKRFQRERKREIMNYSFMSFSTPELTLQEMFDTAIKYGYAGIEPRLGSGHKHGIETTLDAAERAAVKAEIDASDIVVCCLASSCRYANPENRQEWIDRTDEVLDLAGDIGCERIRVFGGTLGKNLTRDEGVKLVVDALKSVAEHAERRNVTICIETHDDWRDPAHLAEVVRNVNHPSVMINWDIMHPVRNGFDIDTAYNTMKPWIAHMHIHDGVDMPDGGVELKPVGEGVIDHKRAIELIKNSDYQGYLSGEWINWVDEYTVHLPREIMILKGLE